jgi:undecaprenyl-diphosphatase
MEWWEAIILGIVQGVTEWLPVSSSGHLAISRHVLGLEASTFYDLILHVGTLLVVVWIFRNKIGRLIWQVLRLPSDASKTSFTHALREPDRGMALFVVIGSIPIALGGFIFAAKVEAAFESLRLVAASLIMTGLLLWSTKKLDGQRSDLVAKDAWFVGLFQMFALLPGVSRSGTTISAGLHMGLDRETAADFAFLLAIPALVGAVLFKGLSAEAGDWGSSTLWLGVLVSAVVGYATLSWLLAYVKERGVAGFAWYCWAIGAVAFGLSFW